MTEGEPSFLTDFGRVWQSAVTPHDWQTILAEGEHSETAGRLLGPGQGYEWKKNSTRKVCRETPYEPCRYIGTPVSCRACVGR